MNTLPDIVMIGPQGSGKGTQASRLVERHAYVDVATGQMLRGHIGAKDALGHQIASYLAHGELVPDPIIEDVVRGRLSSIPHEQPIVFDGFPRNLKQAHILERLFIEQERPQPWAIYLHVARNVVIERLAHRYVCTECGKILQFLGAISHRCPFCGGAVETRTDDKPEVIETRLNLFFEQTLPLIDYYKHRHQLIEIDASVSIDEVSNLIERALKLETPNDR
jgi:adenylate kinase